MTDLNQAETSLEKYKGQIITVFTNEKDTLEKAYKGTLFNFRVGYYIGFTDGNIPFLGFSEGITKIVAPNEEIIYENDYPTKAKFPAIKFSEPEDRVSLNKIRLECFGEGYEI